MPRTDLLDRYAVVTEDGRYFSDIENRRPPVLHHARHPGAGPGLRRRRGINAAKVALAIAVEYAHHRRQFGNPGSGEEEVLLDYGMHQRRLFPLLARTYALHFAQERVAADLHEVFSDTRTRAPPSCARRALESRAAGTKALGTWHASRTIQECREACGGAGYLSVNRFDALRADTDVFTTFEGDNTILHAAGRQGPAHRLQGLLRGPRPDRLVRFVASTAVETVLERTNARSILERLRDVVPGGGRDGRGPGRRACSTPLPPRDAHLARGAHALRRWPAGSSAASTPGGDPAEVFSLCQDHVIGAARAHVERIVLEAFLDKLAGLEPGPNRDALKLLCDLYALSCDRGRPRLVPRARPALQRPVQGGHRAGQRALPPGPPARRSSSSTPSACPREMLRAELLDFSGS